MSSNFVSKQAEEMTISPKMVNSLLTLVLVLLAGQSLCLPVPQMVDLTYSFNNQTPTYTLHKKYEKQNEKEVKTSDTVKYRTADFTQSEHAGTHMDAPYHFVDQRLTIDQIPIEHFEGPAVVVNISAKAAKDPDAEVTVDDLVEWERVNGPIPPKGIVIMFSDWGRFAFNETAYLGGDDPHRLHFPGFSGEACRWLVSERDIVGVGGDTVSADNGPSKEFSCHHHVLGANGFVLENVANVQLLPPSGATIRAFPMKIQGGTGAPTRVIAILPMNPKTESAKVTVSGAK